MDRSQNGALKPSFVHFFQICPYGVSAFLFHYYHTLFTLMFHHMARYVFIIYRINFTSKGVRITQTIMEFTWMHRIDTLYAHACTFFSLIKQRLTFNP